jgi:hypothetical protein
MYNKDNPNYKLYLAGVITENQYYDILEKLENQMLLMENAGFAYVGEGILIPSIHTGGIAPPDSENTKQYVKQILEKYGYWYEGKGERSQKGNGPELKYCKDLGVPNPKNNGSYDDSVTMDGHWAGVPAFSSIEAKWNGSVPIDAIGANSQTMGDAIRNILAEGHGTFAYKDVNIKLSESDIQKIFAVIEVVFPEWENQELGEKKGTEVYNWLLGVEDKMWHEKGNVLSKLGWDSEYDREKQIVEIAMGKKGLFFLGASHFDSPIISQHIKSSPIASTGTQQNAQ